MNKSYLGVLAPLLLLLLLLLVVVGEQSGRLH